MTLQPTEPDPDPDHPPPQPAPDSLRARRYALNLLLTAAGKAHRLPLGNTTRRALLDPRHRAQLLIDLDHHARHGAERAHTARGHQRYAARAAVCNAVLVDTGVRPGTLAAARLDDFDLPAATLTLTPPRPPPGYRRREHRDTPRAPHEHRM